MVVDVCAPELGSTTFLEDDENERLDPTARAPKVTEATITTSKTVMILDEVK